VLNDMLFIVDIEVCMYINYFVLKNRIVSLN